MTEPDLQRHLQAARREVRVRAWGAARIEAAWQELAARQRTTQGSRERMKTVGTAAFALAATLALGLVAWRVLLPAASPPAVEASVASSPAERIPLGEKTDVELDRGAKLDVRERTDARVVVAVRAGTARFRVRHDPSRVFRVEASGVAVEDLGTTFEVENRGSSVRVSVTEGSVAVTFPDAGGGNPTKVTLEAGQSGFYPAGAPAKPVADVTSPATTEAPNARIARALGDGAPTQDWRELKRAGNHGRAYELIAPRGFRDVRDEPGDLMLASDVARLSHHPAEAAMLLRKVVNGHSRDPRAPSAAFTLGWVLMKDLGRPREAAQAFARAESLAPGGNLAQDAAARAVEAWYRAGDVTRARAELERYRASYPSGRHVAMLERLVAGR